MAAKGALLPPPVPEQTSASADRRPNAVGPITTTSRHYTKLNGRPLTGFSVDGLDG